MTNGYFPGARPTLRCLTEDLDFQVPSVDVPLHALDIRIVKASQKAVNAFFAGTSERVRCLGDRVWLKVRSGRSRAIITDLSPEAEDSPRGFWIGASGERRDGDPDDFYATLETRYARDGNSRRYLPTKRDFMRLQSELAARTERKMEQAALHALATSASEGKTVCLEYQRHRVHVRVRMDEGVTLLFVGFEGVYSELEMAAFLAMYEGVEVNDWGCEPDHIAGITPLPGQIIFSTVISPEVLALLLERHESTGPI